MLEISKHIKIIKITYTNKYCVIIYTTDYIITLLMNKTRCITLMWHQSFYNVKFDTSFKTIE